MERLSLLSLAIVLASALSGCSLLQKAYKPVVTTTPSMTATNVVWQTNQVILPPVTNSVTGAVTPAQVVITAQPVTNLVVTPGVTVTNYVENPAVSGTLQTLGTIGSATGIPFAGTAAAALLLIYSIGARILNIRGQKKALQVASTLIDNIDGARNVIKSLPGGPEADAKYISKIVDSQTAAGVREDIHAILKG